MSNLQYPQVFKEKVKLVVFLLLFFIVHTTFVVMYFNYSEIREKYLLQIFIRLLTWTLPPIVFIVLSGKNVIDYLQLKNNLGKGILYGIIIGSAILLTNVLGYYFQNHRMEISLDLGWGLWLKGIILVGFSEEVLFRGLFSPQNK